MVPSFEIGEFEAMSSTYDNDSLIALNGIGFHKFHQARERHSGVRAIEHSSPISDSHCIGQLPLCALLHQPIGVNDRLEGFWVADGGSYLDS